jgi:hypothetical protein
VIAAHVPRPLVTLHDRPVIGRSATALKALGLLARATATAQETVLQAMARAVPRRATALLRAATVIGRVPRARAHRDRAMVIAPATVAAMARVLRAPPAPMAIVRVPKAQAQALAPAMGIARRGLTQAAMAPEAQDRPAAAAVGAIQFATPP